jgi:Zn-dependent protease with chaperone function
MRPAVYLPLVLPVVPLLLPVIAALAARPVAGRLAPAVATWLLTVCAVVLAAASGAALGVLVLAGTLRIPQVAALGHMSLRALHDGDPAGSVPVAMVAGLLFATALGAALRAAWLRARALVAAGHAAACLPAGQLAVVDDETADAFAIPGLTGRRGRVVVSTGMLAALDHAQRRALLAHEHAHLAGRHHLFLAAAHLAAAANPLLRPAERAVAYTVERWADERAAEVTGDRKMTALAVGKAALAKSRRPPPAEDCADNAGSSSNPDGVRRMHGLHCAPNTPGAVLAVDGRADPPAVPLARGGPVPRRVAALLDPYPGPAPRRRLVLAAAVAAIAITSAIAAGDAAAHLHNVIEMAQAAAPGHAAVFWQPAAARQGAAGRRSAADGRAPNSDRLPSPERSQGSIDHGR